MSDPNINTKMTHLLPRYFVITYQSMVINVLKKLETHNALLPHLPYFMLSGWMSLNGASLCKHMLVRRFMYNTDVFITDF